MAPLVQTGKRSFENLIGVRSAPNDNNRRTLDVAVPCGCKRYWTADVSILLQCRNSSMFLPRKRVLDIGNLCVPKITEVQNYLETLSSANWFCGQLHENDSKVDWKLSTRTVYLGISKTRYTKMFWRVERSSQSWALWACPDPFHSSRQVDQSLHEKRPISIFFENERKYLCTSEAAWEENGFHCKTE